MERSVSYLKDDDPMFSPAPAREAPARRVFHALGTMLRGETGFPQADVENDFLRARRRQVADRLAYWVRRRPGSASRLVPLDEVVGALGRRGERPGGPRSWPRAPRGAFAPPGPALPPPVGGPAGNGSRGPSDAASRSRRSRST